MNKIPDGVKKEIERLEALLAGYKKQKYELFLVKMHNNDLGMLIDVIERDLIKLTHNKNAA